jgi:hypothetical protein
VWAIQKESLDLTYLQMWAAKLGVQHWLEKLEQTQ